MKALVAIEDKNDASSILKAIAKSQWPASTRFVLVHVLKTSLPLWDGSLLENGSEELEYESQTAYRLLLDTASELRKQLPDAITETYVTYGRPSDEILAAVNETHPNVLVLGSHCRSRLEPLLRPSVSQQVIDSLPTALEAVHIVDIPPTHTLVN